MEYRRNRKWKEGKEDGYERKMEGMKRRKGRRKGGIKGRKEGG